MTASPLIRGVGTRAAVAINVMSMIGIGPLITIPLVLGSLHGPLSLVGWLLGALLALCDGLVWAELGSRYPGSGGTYGFLLRAFGEHPVARALAFLFVWQTIIVVPLTQATGYIGFANYAGYLVPWISTHAFGVQAVALGAGLVTLLALYRRITTVSKVGLVLGAIAILTLLCVIVASYAHFSPHLAFAMDAHDSVWIGLRAGLGQALVIAMYDYIGYGQAASLGDEVIAPARTLPRAIVAAIAIVAVLYVSMQLGVLGAVDWHAFVPLADGTLPPLGQHLASAVVERAFGFGAASAVTLLILVTAFASTYANLLGASRIPYAAAVDGNFLKPFAHVHPRERFPDVALLVMGVLALAACLFRLDQVINALTAAGVLIQSVAQIGALFAMRARGERAPYRMWLFPLPALVALAGWAYIFVSSGAPAMLFGVATLALGGAVYAVAFVWRPGRVRSS
ncbi:MAG: APC family permease [bacterium]|nr:APC family permease [bacterium]